MSCKEYSVSICDRKDIKDFVETHHYSKNINGVISDYCFSLKDKDGALIGGMIFGRMAMAGQYKKFSENAEDVIELRRLVLIDDTLRNAESYFIGKALKYLKKNTQIKIVVSYADLTHGHSGIVYKASNFKLHSVSPRQKKISFNGKLYHDKSLRTKNKGILKPFSVRLRSALAAGEANWVTCDVKNCYIYTLKIDNNMSKN